jgi:hypothetical protein
MTKTDNNESGTRAKAELRTNVLEAMGEAHVFDVYCGLEGVMHSLVWHRAASYMGCDLRWNMSDKRRRFVGDSLRVLRCVDLSPYNVFDVDAYGDPWPSMIVLMARRTWKPGERGAVVITDGSLLKTRFGVSTRGITELAGMGVRFAPTHQSGEMLGRLALSAWLKRQSLKPVHLWEAVAASAKGSNKMHYTALVFEAQ